MPTAAPPVERISASPQRPNFRACQEHRLLLDETAKNNSKAVAAYRILRTRILQRARQQRWTTIGVTSAGINDGKSLTTLNLSLSLARERNSEVVLLDLDMRNPSICRYLGIEPSHHLSHYLEGRTSARDVFFSMGVDNLLLAAGTVRPEQASELLGTSRLDELLEYIKQHTQNPIILLDLPPLLNTDDALVVVPKIDAILLVAAEGRTDRAALEKAVDLLADVPLAGLVLNRAVETGDGDDYGYGYGYGPD
jgi:protein-tyrosine kinase